MGGNKSQGPPKAANRVAANRGLKTTALSLLALYTAATAVLALNALFHWWEITPG